jgi:hypothetical protein
MDAARDSQRSGREQGGRKLLDQARAEEDTEGLKRWIVLTHVIHTREFCRKCGENEELGILDFPIKF